MEYIIAAFWGITAVCGIGLMTVYWTSGQAQYEGALLLLAFASLGRASCCGLGTCCPATTSRPAEAGTCPTPRKSRHRRRPCHGGRRPILSRRGFLVKKVLVPVGGIFGMAAMWPLASLGTRPGNALYHTKWDPGARLVTEDGNALPSTTSWSTGS